jgi:hypothetical protein
MQFYVILTISFDKATTLTQHLERPIYRFGFMNPIALNHIPFTLYMPNSSENSWLH